VSRINPKDVFPARNLPGDSEKWGRSIEDEVKKVRKQGEVTNQFLKASNRQSASTASNLGEQIAAIANASVVEQSSFNTGITGFTGWYATVLAQVTVTSLSGRISVTWGGTLNGGDGFFCYEVKQGASTLITRASILSDPSQRVAVSGGASFAPSGYNTRIITVPAGVATDISLQLNTGSSFTYYFGGSILAHPVL